jgi:hypothetical protein
MLYVWENMLAGMYMYLWFSNESMVIYNQQRSIDSSSNVYSTLADTLRCILFTFSKLIVPHFFIFNYKNTHVSLLKKGHTCYVIVQTNNIS